MVSESLKALAVAIDSAIHANGGRAPDVFEVSEKDFGALQWDAVRAYKAGPYKALLSAPIDRCNFIWRGVPVVAQERA